ncbi:dolichyl-diphosphooligosaccharide--protein glycosyltransferase 48 kDa subunit [Lepeophtheirus salmonis]|uniref:dolichyl-diphosphooligosaccharide--protein glycosyltransferase 48 kDa subunit n=1 Tax=Lepeophtheirus salmonis TaxID=72036 RepID=UPI001AE48110|nr:dolichyl-diphosphooligosaccharide--protein glycosyltransferase 48 kDa subunit-like [Lepeophtheirus salmonis]
MLRVVLCLFLGLLGICHGGRVLVLLDNNSYKESHATFLKDLSDLGLDLTYKTSDDSSIVLKKYGEFLFDHLVLMSPNVEEFGGGLTPDVIADFLDAGKDVFVGGVESSDLLREFASECGFEVDEEGSMVLDHIHYDSVKDEEGLHTVVVAEPGKHLIKSAPIVGSAVGDKPLLYKGVGILADANPLVLPILSSSSYAYSYNPNKPIKEYPHATGKNTLLIAGLQARNNARVIFSGSLDFFSNDYFESSVHSRGAESPSGNRDLAKALVSWCFKESGLLRTSQLKHHLVGQTESPPFYTVTEDVEYSIVIEEFKGGKWVPYSAKDVQLEFVRIDPFVRINLKPDGNGKFSAKFKIPDVYGVYQFKINYVRTGISRLYSTTQVSVRPLRHDQYERFILSAYPYYASAFSMMFGVFVFGFVFLHHKEASPKTKSE